MGRFYESRTWVECPRCALRSSLHQKRQKKDVTDGRWKLSWAGEEHLRVGRLRFRGWLGMWQAMIGGEPRTVPPHAVVGSA